MIPYEQSVQRTRAILQRQLAADLLFHDWELELATVLGVQVPDEPIEELLELFEALTAHTPFPDGIGPWRPHPVWAEETYGIGHVRSIVRLFANDDIQVPRSAALIIWVRRLQKPDGSFAAQEEFEKLYRVRHPQLASDRDALNRAAWTRALGERAPDVLHWAHSDLEDAWCALDALDAMDAKPTDVETTTRWLRSRQRLDGAFRAPLELDRLGNPYGDVVADTMWAARALALVGGTPTDHEACIGWLLRAQVVPAVVPQWQRIEALGALGAIGRLPPAALDRWDLLSFSEDENAEMVDFEAYAAIRAHRWLVRALS
jgi:hypothetical protein